jgi:hypothetical protein
MAIIASGGKTMRIIVAYSVLPVPDGVRSLGLVRITNQIKIGSTIIHGVSEWLYNDRWNHSHVLLVFAVIRSALG